VTLFANLEQNITLLLSKQQLLKGTEDILHIDLTILTRVLLYCFQKLYFTLCHLHFHTYHILQLDKLEFLNQIKLNWIP
jgi:hypothetical protein